MTTPTTSRVAENTPEWLNENIERQTRQIVACCAAQGPMAIERRLAELDWEWDVERVLETMAPTFTLGGLLLGLTKSRKWLALPVLVNTFFLQHAIQGWCPPLPVLRWLGFRTAEEIDRERMALKILRGDFHGLPLPEKSEMNEVDQALAAASR